MRAHINGTSLFTVSYSKNVLFVATSDLLAQAFIVILWHHIALTQIHEVECKQQLLQRYIVTNTVFHSATISWQRGDAEKRYRRDWRIRRIALQKLAMSAREILFGSESEQAFIALKGLHYNIFRYVLCFFQHPLMTMAHYSRDGMIQSD